jgi:hypothetical protein
LAEAGIPNDFVELPYKCHTSPPNLCKKAIILGVVVGREGTHYLQLYTVFTDTERLGFGLFHVTKAFQC